MSIHGPLICDIYHVMGYNSISHIKTQIKPKNGYDDDAKENKAGGNDIESKVQQNSVFPSRHNKRKKIKEYL